MTNQELEDLLSGLEQSPPNVNRIAERLDGLARRLSRMNLGIGILLCYVVFTAPFFLLFAGLIIRDINRGSAGPRPPAALEAKSKAAETNLSIPAASDSPNTPSMK